MSNMLDILKNFDAAEKGEKTANPADTGSMKAILEGLHQVASGEEIKESAAPVAECGDMPMEMPAMQSQGQPVTVSITASGKDNVDELMAILKGAGIEQHVDMPMAHDAEIEMPNASQEMDMDTMRQIMAAGEKELPALEMDDTDIQESDKEAGLQKIRLLYLQNTASDMASQDSIYAPGVNGAAPAGDVDKKAAMIARKYGITDQELAKIRLDALQSDADMAAMEEWDNAPDEEYGSEDDVLPAGDDMHRPKDRKAIRTNDPALESSIKNRLWAALAEKKMSKKKTDAEVDEGEKHGNSKEYDDCWDGYERVPGTTRGEKGSCRKK